VRTRIAHLACALHPCSVRLGSCDGKESSLDARHQPGSSVPVHSSELSIITSEAPYHNCLEAWNEDALWEEGRRTYCRKKRKIICSAAVRSRHFYRPRDSVSSKPDSSTGSTDARLRCGGLRCGELTRAREGGH